MPLPLALARLVAAGLLLAALLNGAGFFLKRIGVIDPTAYAAYLAEHCDREVGKGWIGNHCSVWKPLATDPPRFEEYDARHLYSSQGAEVLLKLAKYGFVAAFLLISVKLIAAGRAPPLTPRQLWRVLPLSTAVVIAALTALVQSDPWPMLAGLRSFAFLPVALLGAWLATDRGLSLLAQAIALLLVSQLLLVPLEVLYGLPLHKGYPLTADWSLPSRMAGSFVMANSLGVFCAIALAFYYAFYERRRYIPWLSSGALGLILLSRSATGLVGLLALLAWASLVDTRRQGRRLPWVGGALLLAAFLLGLPHLLAREDLLASLVARLDKLWGLAVTGSILELLLGRGLGIGTNLATSLMDSVSGLPGLWLTPSDSTPIALFAQTGLVGLLAFYGLIGYGMVRDPVARPFYLVWILTSLMQTLTELFPADFLLGLVLSRSLWDSAGVLPNAGKRTMEVENGQQPAVAGTVTVEHIGDGWEQGFAEQSQPGSPAGQAHQVGEDSPPVAPC